MENGNELVVYDRMCSAIAECHRLAEVKEIKGQALAFEVYAKQARNTDAERMAQSIRLRAERRLGELLKELQRATPAEAGVVSGEVRSGNAPHAPDRSSYAQALAGHGISTQSASRYQRLADVPHPVFEAALADSKKPSTTSIIAKHGRELALREAEKSRPYRPQKKLSKKDKEGIAEIDRLRSIGVSLLTSYARPLLSMLRSQSTFTDAERALVADLVEAGESVLKVCEIETG